MARRNNGSNGSSEEEVPKAKLNKENVREALLIFSYIKPYRWKFIIGLLFIGLSGLSTMAFPYFLKKLIDSAQKIQEGQVALSPGTIALAMIGLLLVQMLFSYMRIYLFSSVGENALADMRKEVYQRMITMPMDFFANRRVGELSSRLSSDLSQIQDAVSVLLAEVLRSIITLLVGMGLIFYLSAKLTMVMLSVIPLIIVIAVIFGKRIRKLAKEAQDQLADSGTVVQETLQGISNVKAFSNEWYEIGRYGSSINKVVNLAIRNAKFRGMFVSFLLFSTFSAIVLVVWYGIGLMQQGQLSFGDLTAFVVYTAFVGGTMAGFAEMYSQLQKTVGATQRVRELLKEVPEAVDVARIVIDEAHRIHGAVTLEHVAFSYPSRNDVPVLKDVSITAYPGQTIAIVGPSGAGKSTLASLLLRFYTPDSGNILFDGRNAEAFSLSQLRQQMALVPQDVLLFGGTILENIAYGKPDASQEDVEAAARKANAHDFIMGFPEGYQTVVGERGMKLSGGQRQRLAIARAILKDPVILILDEATSALDSASEQLVQEALDNLMQNRTSFVIAHRLSTIRNADRIAVLDKGVVKESGTHEELMSIEDGLYKQLNKLQYEKGIEVLG